ncbi:MAG: hypothetical protein EBU03_04275 [Methylophilaceae bacterium]|nr:hypothetical protein [Methylophilaceae bacterium]
MAAGSTYTPIATTTLGSAASSYTFSSIPGTYTDLVLVVYTKNSVQLDSLGLQFNSDTGSNYSNTGLSGNGSSASSYRQTNQSEMNIGLISTNDAINIIQIMNYSNSTTYKTAISRANVPAELVRAVVGLWRSTSAITSIKVKDGSGNNMSIGTTMTLYGIQAA